MGFIVYKRQQFSNPVVTGMNDDYAGFEGPARLSQPSLFYQPMRRAPKVSVEFADSSVWSATDVYLRHGLSPELWSTMSRYQRTSVLVEQYQRVCVLVQEAVETENDAFNSFMRQPSNTLKMHYESTRNNLGGLVDKKKDIAQAIAVEHTRDQHPSSMAMG